MPLRRGALHQVLVGDELRGICGNVVTLPKAPACRPGAYFRLQAYTV